MHPAMKTTGNARVKGQLAGSGQRVPVPGKRGGKREWGPVEHGAGGRERRHSKRPSEDRDDRAHLLVPGFPKGR